MPNGTSNDHEELRADPAALASGAYDAPAKKDKQRQSEASTAANGLASADRPQSSTAYQYTRQASSGSQTAATQLPTNLNGS